MLAMLPPEILEGYRIAEETQTAYETSEELAARASLVSLDRYPAFASALATIQAGDMPESFSWESLPTEVWDDLFFAMGARGISLLVQGTLPDARTADDLSSIADLTTMRHQLLF